MVFTTGDAVTEGVAAIDMISTGGAESGVAQPASMASAMIRQEMNADFRICAFALCCMNPLYPCGL